MLLAHVILPLNVSQEYTYEIPPELSANLAEGSRVEVQFGAKRIYSGIVKKIFEATDLPFAVKPILNVLDNAPIVNSLQLRFWQWLSEYYLCSEGEVLTAALPTALRLSSETQITLNPSFSQDFSLLDDREYLVAEALTLQDEISINEVRDILDSKHVIGIIKGLMDKGVLLIKEALVEKYKPRTSTFAALHEDFRHNTTKLEEIFKKTERAPKQLALLLASVHYLQTQQQEWVEKSILLEKSETSDAAYKALIEKQILVEKQQIVSRIKDTIETPLQSFALSEEQTRVLSEINSHFETHSVALLHGATSSGKTQLYIELIRQVIAQGKQALYLLPEIALTTQIIVRLRQVFGNDIGVCHSRFNDQERVEIWHKLMRHEYKVVIGPRSALFLPFDQLGIVIVDEEHDPSYKQQDPAPRYHARDAVIYLAYLHGAKTLLGSATPSLESYYNATKLGKYALATLSERYGGAQMPHVEVVNMRKAQEEGLLKTSFSDRLLNEINLALQNGEQTIVFQNRRGYNPYILCDACGWIPQCIQCDVSLTYHKYANELRCHYCGFRRKMASRCESCEGTYLKEQGAGTEKIEDQLQIYFPQAKIGRLDLEVANTKTGFERVIGEFEQRKIHILVGTQMVTKGLDFDNVSVVGIVSADQLLNFPDFRANERAFCLMTQVGGRAGRRQKQGKVIIQSLHPHKKNLEFIVNNDYNSFFVEEMYERMRYQYPPFTRLIILTIKHLDSEKANAAAIALFKDLRQGFGDRILGPATPLVSRVRNYHLRQIMFKLEKSAAILAHHKQVLRDCLRHFAETPEYKGVVLQIDVDPY